MPGANCSFPGCHINRGEKYKGIAIFRVSQRNLPNYVTWREEVVEVIKRYRVVDEDFKRQIKANNIRTCERHYKDEDIEYTSK